jgi:predicted nucleic acid-binding protein
MRKPRVFIDADVLFAGSASSEGASYIILSIAEMTLIECITSEQARAEAERNLADKLPQTLPVFHLLVHRCLQVVPNPPLEEVVTHAGQADPKDLPILVAALREQCSHLITFNTRHYYETGTIAVLRPGEFMMLIRRRLSLLSPNGDRE